MIVRALAMFALKCHLPESDVQKVLEIIPPQNKPPGKTFKLLGSNYDQTPYENVDIDTRGMHFCLQSRH